MKIKTLMQIAGEIGRESRIQPKLTISEMAARLETVAGNCRTKDEARAAIAREIFKIEAE